MYVNRRVKLLVSVMLSPYFFQLSVTTWFLEDMFFVFSRFLPKVILLCQAEQFAFISTRRRQHYSPVSQILQLADLSSPRKEGLKLNFFSKEANDAGEIKRQTFSRSYTRWCRVGLERFGERRLARWKSPVLTALTTRPFQKKWPRDEFWWVSIWHAFKIRLCDTLWCDCSTAAYDHSDPEEIG